MTLARSELTPPRVPCPQSNTSTLAQLAIEDRGFVEVHLVRMSNPNATFTNLDTNIKSLFVNKVKSETSLDETVFRVSFDGKVYTVAMPESLVPLAMLPDSLITVKDVGYIVAIKEVKQTTTGQARISDDNWATMRLHKCTAHHASGMPLPAARGSIKQTKKPGILVGMCLFRCF